MLILAITLATWLDRRHLPVSPWWPSLTLFWVCVRGHSGAFTVTMPAVSGHCYFAPAGRFGVVGLAAHAGAALPAWRALGHSPARLACQGRHRALWLGVFALLWLQIALGGWVSTNYAVLACSDFPQCQGSWWPSMDFAHGFSLWRELGETRQGDGLPFAALTAIHFVHRLGAVVVIAGLIWLACSLHARP